MEFRKVLSPAWSHCLDHQHGSCERCTDKGPGLPEPGSRDLAGAVGKRTRESFRGSQQWGILGKGFAQGHRLPISPSSSRIAPLALSRALDRLVRQPLSQRSLGARNVKKAGNPAMSLELSTMQYWKGQLLTWHKPSESRTWCTVNYSLSVRWPFSSHGPAGFGRSPGSSPYLPPFSFSFCCSRCCHHCCSFICLSVASPGFWLHPKSAGSHLENPLLLTASGSSSRLGKAFWIFQNITSVRRTHVPLTVSQG